MRNSVSHRTSSLTLFLLLSIFVALASGCSGMSIRSASASRGSADLSGLDFRAGGLARLDGEWEFYPDALLGPEDFRSGAVPPPELTRVPGLWSSVEGFSRPRRPVTGFGTLRLTVHLPPDDRLWALRIPNANSALRAYVDGERLAEIGFPADETAGYIPSNGIAVPEFRFSGNRPLEIILQVANFSTPYIGTWDSPILGAAETINSKRGGDLVSTALISGALLIMGLYHLGLFLLRSKDRASLLFGVSCILMTVRNLIMGERILLALFPPGIAGWEWAFKVEHLSAHLTVPLFALFFRELYPRQVRKIPVLATIIVGSIWATLILTTPAMVHHRFLHWYELFLLVAGIYVLGAIAAAAIAREEGALLVAAGLLLLLGTAANDVFLSIGLISNTFYMASYGVFLYIFTQSFHLSMIFSNAFREVESLSEGLKAKNRELESLHTIDLAIASSMELEKILSVILKESVEHLEADAADILLLDAPMGTLSLGARLGFRTDALRHTHLKAGQGFAGQALLSEEAIFVSGLDRNAEGFSRSPAFAGEEFVFYAGRRLTVKEKNVGVIELYRRSPFQPSQSWALFFKTLAGQAAIALDNSALLRSLRQANEELAEANEATIESWAEALELRDRETEGHSRRVTEATIALARRFGIDGVDLDQVRHGALLHDIGKMGIPDSILLKPGPLDPEEFAVMQRHPTIARDLLSRLPFLQSAIDIPYCHHEKWDGSGYPQGIAGAEIPLPARLFAVVDVWDALCSDRPYRRAWPEEQVLGHIAALSGTHFDPEAVAAFIELRMESSRQAPAIAVRH